MTTPIRSGTNTAKSNQRKAFIPRRLASRKRRMRIGATRDGQLIEEIELSSTQFPVRCRVVDISEDSGVVHFEKLRRLAVLADDRVRARVLSQSHQLIEQRASDQHRVSALALVGRNNDGSARSVKRHNELRDGRRAEGRMIDERQYDAIDWLPGERFQSCLKRGGLPALVVRVEQDLDVREVGGALDFSRMMAQHDDDSLHTCAAQCRDDALEKRAAAIHEQRLVTTHACRLARREDQARDAMAAALMTCNAMGWFDWRSHFAWWVLGL